MQTKTIAVIGAGPAGMEASANLVKLGHQVVLIEKQSFLGGHLNNWYHLFPDRRPATEILSKLEHGLSQSGIQVMVNSTVQKVIKNDFGFQIFVNNNNAIIAHAVLVTTGFDLFDATEKEEYGYGMYNQVITNSDLENLFQTTNLRNQFTNPVKRVAFVHCVGSRDAKVNNHYCSKVCCVTAVKQAIELKERMPETEVFCFYMDMRMFGPHYEELYREAQEKWGIVFVRGKISEASQNKDGSLQIKAEDTLASKPLRMNTDLLVLMAGMIPAAGSELISKQFNIKVGNNRFFKSSDNHLDYQLSTSPGVFLAGACVAPMNITDTISQARAAALRINEYLKN